MGQCADQAADDAADDGAGDGTPSGHAQGRRQRSGREHRPDARNCQGAQPDQQADDAADARADACVFTDRVAAAARRAGIACAQCVPGVAAGGLVGGDADVLAAEAGIDQILHDALCLGEIIK